MSSRDMVWCDDCGEWMKPEDELCPECESFLGPTEEEWEAIKPAFWDREHQ